MILVVAFYRYTAVRPALLPDGKRGYRAAIQGLHALSLASLDAICGIGCVPQPFQEQVVVLILIGDLFCRALALLFLCHNLIGSVLVRQTVHMEQHVWIAV